MANGRKVKFSDELYLFYKDQGYTKDEIIKMADSQIGKWVSNLKTKI